MRISTTKKLLEIMDTIKLDLVEVPEGTITAIVFPPMYESEVPEFIKGLKLL